MTDTEISHRVGRVLLAFGACGDVRWLRKVILPTGVHSIEEFHQRSRLYNTDAVRQWSELSGEQQRCFPLQRAKFVGSVYVDATRECTLYYTCRTNDDMRKGAASLGFDWLCAWCVDRVDVHELCALGEE